MAHMLGSNQLNSEPDQSKEPLEFDCDTSSFNCQPQEGPILCYPADLTGSSNTLLLKLDRQLVETVASQGLDPLIQPQTSSYSENKALEDYPKNIKTIIHHLAINPDLNYLIF
ncbi:hypothetical protein VP01_339g8 [Puccinia sorghi]|uniref:Uncharacterized protein n=1 Tax=Puccinia sorghi TaxID=27349 RepID=A0A0L6UWL2_9BASI|nr:hypothetical protein VP01_339g8 [Puccinia sorghi]